MLARNLLWIIITATAMTACRPVVSYPEEPAISFTSITVTDSLDVLENPIKLVIINFHLIDGNGDVGLDSTYIDGPFHPDSAFHHNLIIKEFYRDNDRFVEVPLPAGLKKYRIPDLTRSGQNKTLIADVSVKIEYPYNQALPLPYNEMQYQFYLFDRAFNKSNTDTTTSIILY